MTHYEVLIADQAAQDLRGIYEYIAIDLLSPGNAMAQLNRLEVAIKGLGTFPERHRQYEAEPWKSLNLRVLPVDNFVMFYIPDNAALTVTIIRVIYGGRDMEAQLNR